MNLIGDSQLKQIKSPLERFMWLLFVDDKIYREK